MRNNSTTEEPGARNIAQADDNRRPGAAAVGIVVLDAITMSSIEIADLCGKELSHVHRDIRAMIGALVGISNGSSDGRSLDWKMTKDSFAPLLDHEEIQGVSVEWDHRGYASTIRLPKSLTMTLVAGYNVKLRKRIIDRWLELESGVAKPAAVLSPAQMLLQMAQLHVDQERRLNENEQAIAEVQQRIEDLSETRAFTSCPSNAEPITHIRKRIGEEYGLSAKVVDQILRQSPYAPKPAGEVKNPHEEAQGATYTVWWTKDVSAVFKRVAAEAVQVTDAQYTHPYIEGRFKVRGRKPEKGPPSRGDLFEPEPPP